MRVISRCGGRKPQACILSNQVEVLCDNAFGNHHHATLGQNLEFESASKSSHFYLENILECFTQW